MIRVTESQITFPKIKLFHHFKPSYSSNQAREEEKRLKRRTMKREWAGVKGIPQYLGFLIPLPS
jgi:hypothetical protein